MLSCVQLFVTPGTVAYHAPLSMGFSRQKYWTGLSFPSPRDLPDQRTESTSAESPALTGRCFPWGLWEVPYYCVCVCVCVCVCLVAQSCQTLCHPMNCSPPGFSVHEISQAIMLEWVAILFSGGSSWPLGLLLCRQILYWLSHQRSPLARTVFFKDLVSLCLSSLLCLSW